MFGGCYWAGDDFIRHICAIIELAVFMVFDDRNGDAIWLSLY